MDRDRQSKLSAADARRMKEAAQARDHELAARGAPPDATFLLPSRLAKQARVRAWPAKLRRP